MALCRSAGAPQERQRGSSCVSFASRRVVARALIASRNRAPSQRVLVQQAVEPSIFKVRHAQWWLTASNFVGMLLLSEALASG